MEPCANGILGFNPRLHAGGDRLSRSSAWRWRSFQSAPPRGRRRQGQPEIMRVLRVSIRASTREATARGVATWARAVFQSAPPRGRRPRGRVRRGRGRGFNPRLHAGGDLPRPLGDDPQGVSIRASTREATGARGTPGPPPRRFNPRLHAGGDWSSGSSPGPRSGFNPRLHAGGDRADSARRSCAWRFQSAPPRGRRPAPRPPRRHSS